MAFALVTAENEKLMISQWSIRRNCLLNRVEFEYVCAYNAKYNEIHLSSIWL